MNQNHQRIKKLLKWTGLAVLCSGAAFTVTGFADFFISMNSFESPKLFWCLFVGFPSLAIGVILLSYGFHREVNTYLKNEAIPVINEASIELKPTIENLASAVRPENGSIVCPCGTVNEPGSRFCTSCGMPLSTVCKKCGNQLAVGSKFCNQCGTKQD